MTTRIRRLFAALLLATLALPTPAAAHFIAPGVVNQVAQLWFGADYLRFDGSIDYGELQAPAVERIADEAGDGDGVASKAELAAAPALICADWFEAFSLEMDGERLVLDLTHTELHPYQEDGSGQLYEVHCSADADIDGATIALGSSFVVENRYLPTVPGAREYQAITDIEQVSRSGMITRDPTENTFRFSVIPFLSESTPAPSEAPAPSPSPSASPAGVDWEAMLPGLPRELPADFGGGIFALLFAAVIGAGHALTPGHGKTLIGAALLGQRATVRRAVLLGLTVSFAHTVGVLLMALVVTVVADASVTGAAARYAPLAAAVAMLFIGCWMLWDARRGHDHHHDHHHDHRHRRDHTHGAKAAPGSFRALLLIGVSGGIVPSASALVVLVGAIAAGAAAWGVAVVLAFGVGMAAVMSAVAVTASRLGSRLDRSQGLGHTVAHRLPALSGAVVVLLSLGLIAGALAAA